ncbi:hypothetical protein [Nostoc sp.]
MQWQVKGSHFSWCMMRSHITLKANISRKLRLKREAENLQEC